MPPLLGLPQAPAFPPCLILTGLPLPEVPTGAHVLPRGGTNARRVAQSVRKRSGASIFCSGAPSLGREEESQICPNLALPAWPPSSVWGGDRGGMTQAWGREPRFQRHQLAPLWKWRAVGALLLLQRPGLWFHRGVGPGLPGSM